MKGKVYKSSEGEAWTSRDNKLDSLLNEDSWTASLFSKAVSSCSFVREEKYPLDDIVPCRKSRKVQVLSKFNLAAD